MIDRFIRKLRHATRFTPEDEQMLAGLARSVRSFNARSDVIGEGDEPRSLLLVIEGWACRYRQLENGKRQIISLVVPGDLCEPFGVLPPLMNHSLAALTPVMIASVPLDRIAQAVGTNARIHEALWWDLLINWHIEREHVVSLGRRSAAERMGHFFCELHYRLQMVGLVEGMAFDMPLTQIDLGDVLGLSSVHVNRSLQELRRSGLISLLERRLIIRDLQSLREFCFFDSAYLSAAKHV